MSFTIDELKLSRPPGTPPLQLTLNMVANADAEECPGYSPSLLPNPVQNAIIWTLGAPVTFKNCVDGPVNFSLFPSLLPPAAVNVVEENGLTLLRGGVVVVRPKGPPYPTNFQVTSDLCLMEMDWKRINSTDFFVQTIFDPSADAENGYLAVDYAFEISPTGKPFLVFYVDKSTMPPGVITFPDGVIVNTASIHEFNALHAILWDRANGPVVDWSQPVNHFCCIYFKHI